MDGFFNKVLHIDLGQQHYWEEELKDDVFYSWLGGRGLGCFLLWKNLKPGIDPLSPGNVIIFATGPATGTKIPLSSRYGVYTKSPLTNFFVDSYSGGTVAPAIKATGYDAIILHGASPSPIFLEISPQGVKFWDASQIWGKDTYQTEEECLKKVGVPEAKAVVIGPAGENLVRFACIVNNRWRSAGRGGTGAVLGAKKVKAIVFHGDKKTSIAHPREYEALVQELVEKGKNSPIARTYRQFGTPYVVGITNPAKAFPTEYWTKGSLEGWENISARALLSKFKVRPKACPRCFFACGKLTTITEGRHSGLTIEGPEYETIYSFGGLCKILDLAEIAYLNDICDRMGIDTITAGNLIAFLMELSKRGRFSPQIDYGDADKSAEILLAISYRQGIGDILAEGIVKASKELGAEDLAIHIKGMEPAGYDPRVLKGMALGYATSPRGACHLPATFYIVELRGIMEPSQVEGKARLYIEYEDRLTIMDTLILCRFYRDMMTWEVLSQILKVITGLELDREKLKEIANNISTLRRLINLREGLRKEDDFLPPRFFTEPRADNGAVVNKEEFLFMLREYYQLRGWDIEGKPLTMPPLLADSGEHLPR